jgi:hypothetical protein
LKRNGRKLRSRTKTTDGFGKASDDLFQQAVRGEAALYMSIVNLREAYYGLIKDIVVSLELISRKRLSGKLLLAPCPRKNGCPEILFLGQPITDC